MIERERIAGAPITWGVSEVPGWGVQLPPERVLDDMQRLGLAATEFGPDGWLPEEHHRLISLLEHYDLELVGGFVPAVLHEPAQLTAQLAEVERQAHSIAVAGGTCVLLAAATGYDGYEGRPDLDDAGWDALLRGLARACEVVNHLGLTPSLHPHWGTLVESAADLQRVLDGSDVPLCIDTGHMALGGCDLLEFAREHGHRVEHAHLKDVDMSLGGRVSAGELSFRDGVENSMFVPLGAGHLPVLDIVRALEASGFEGWYVLEQDCAIGDDEVDPSEDAARSLEALLALTETSPAPDAGRT